MMHPALRMFGYGVCGAIMLIILSFVVAMWCSSPDKTAPNINDAAKGACEIFIYRHYNEPKIDLDSERVTKVNNVTYVVNATMTAKNNFGVDIQVQEECRMSYYEDKWYMKSVEQVG
jgi:hypothetical protein